MEEVLDETQQTRRRLQVGSGGFDVTDEANDRSFQVTTPPKAELIAIGIEKIRERLELLPLLL
ncbi:MAG TPA: hypothetical protein VGP73_08645, partial [Thermoanaerobaculia bacterium]